MYVRMYVCTYVCIYVCMYLSSISRIYLNCVSISCLSVCLTLVILVMERKSVIRKPCLLVVEWMKCEFSLFLSSTPLVQVTRRATLHLASHQEPQDRVKTVAQEPGLCLTSKIRGQDFLLRRSKI